MEDDPRTSATSYKLLDVFRGREPPPLASIACRSSYPWLIVGTVCVGAFMGQLDASIAQLVLPVLEHDFALPVSTVSWVSIAYLLSLTAVLPVVSRLADRQGRKLLYVGGFLLFILGSALCGAAPDLGSLIGFRVMQGAGAAFLQANSVAIIVNAVGEHRRGRAIGIQAAAQAVGLSAGPAIGGLLIAALGWRWVFWLNVPFGLIGAALGWLVLPQSNLREEQASFDWLGALLLAPALTAVLLLIQQGPSWGAASPAFIATAVTAMVLLPVFVWSQHRRHDPLLDLRLFRNHAFWAGNLAALFSYAMLFGIFFLMPFVFERGYHEGAFVAGLRLALVPVALGVAAPIGGFFYDHIGPRALTVAGMVLSLGACALLAHSVSGMSQSLIMPMVALAVFGIGQGLFTAPNNSSIMGAAPADRSGEAGGILNVTRSLGTSIGIASSSTILAWRLGAVTGQPGDTLHAPPSAVLNASHDVITMLAFFAIGAGLLSLARRHYARRAQSVVIAS